MSFPFISSNDLKSLLISDQHPLHCTVSLKNALVSDENIMQPTLLMGLMKALDRNRREGVDSLLLFECARAFLSPNAKEFENFPYFKNLKKTGQLFSERSRAEQDRIIERPVITAIMTPPYISRTCHGEEKAPDFFIAKKKAVDLLQSLGIKKLSLDPVQEGDLPFLHPGASAYIKAGSKIIGYIGELHPKVIQSYNLDINQSYFAFELLLENSFQAYQKGYEIVTDSFKFPASTRDLALVVERTTTHRQFEECMNKFKKKNLRKYELFDIYEGEGIASDKKSMAYKFFFQSGERTLTDKEVDKEIQGILRHLQNGLSAELR